MDEEVEPSFRQELAALINKYSLENLSDTPDLVLGVYLQGCLSAFNVATRNREKWYGREPADLRTKEEK